MQVESLGVTQVDMPGASTGASTVDMLEALTVDILLAELLVVTMAADMAQAAGALELVSGAAEATMVVKATTGQLVSSLQVTIKCFKVRACLIKWA